MSRDVSIRGGTVDDATHADIVLKVADLGRLRGKNTMYFEIQLISCNHEKQVHWSFPKIYFVDKESKNFT